MPKTILRRCVTCLEEKKSSDFYVNRVRKEYMKSCSACSVKRTNAYQTKKWSEGDYRFILMARANSIRRDCKRRKNGSITCADDLGKILVKLWEIQGGRCAYTDLPMQLGGGSFHFSESRNLHCTVDRLDSAMGYEAGNVILCCADINRMKQEGSLEDFFSKCEKIVKTRAIIRRRITLLTT